MSLNYSRPRTADEILAAHNIKRPRKGSVYTLCPECSAARSTPAHRTDPVLHLTIDAEGVRWFCNHCPFQGGEFYESRVMPFNREEIYSYQDADGKEVFQCIRKHPKGFYQRQPDGHGGYINNLRGVTLVPYKLPELLRAKAPDATAVIVEGEKDVNSCRERGIIASCNPMGAGKWREQYSIWFKGFESVCIIADKDDVGRKHAQNIAKSVSIVVPNVRVIELEQHDASDFFAAGGTVDELSALIDAAAPWANGHDPNPEPSSKVPLKPVADPVQEKIYVLSDSGKVIPNVANAIEDLSKDVDFHGLLGFDEMLVSPVLMRPLNGEASFKPRAITDADITLIQRDLQKRSLARLAASVTHQAIEVIAHENSFHPVRDYLDSLKWDGTERLEHWLADFIGCEQNAYTAAVGRMFIISMVARIFYPGCKCDYMLILEGEQGIMKSSACKVLSDPWFSDHLPDVRGKDASQHLRGKWLIEVAELHVFDRVETALLKSFITRQEERYRPPFGRMEVFERRQCVFVGTTNKTEYLKDETGARRFWPVQCGKIMIDELCAMRNALFAEGVARLKAGEKWWPTREFEAECITPQQQQRYEPDMWEDQIGRIIKGRSHTTITELAEALGIPKDKQGTIIQRRIIACLAQLGWHRSDRKEMETRRALYVPKGQDVGDMLEGI